MKPILLAIALLMPPLLTPAPLLAQASEPAKDGAALDGSVHPADVLVRTAKTGQYYADAQGRTLYALDMRIAGSRSGETLKYCIGPCAKIWAPLTAPSDAKPVGRWKVLVGAQGPQWSYRNNLVFTFVADRKPGDMAGDAYDDLWHLIPHIPPAPALIAPANVVPVFADQAWVLTEAGAHALFIPRTPDCGSVCTSWTPFAAGIAARDIGDWTVLRTGDTPQWAWRGKPVFESQDEKPIIVPAEGVLLKL
jgi:predicted lipoprotein with Yx(FWY)xxD motif